VIALVNQNIEPKTQDPLLHLYINSKILLQVEFYNGFFQIVEFRSTLSLLHLRLINKIKLTNLDSNTFQIFEKI
jgi:hypothetical protein